MKRHLLALRTVSLTLSVAWILLLKVVALSNKPLEPDQSPNLLQLINRCKVFWRLAFSSSTRMLAGSELKSLLQTNLSKLLSKAASKLADPLQLLACICSSAL